MLLVPPVLTPELPPNPPEKVKIFLFQGVLRVSLVVRKGQRSILYNIYEAGFVKLTYVK